MKEIENLHEFCAHHGIKLSEKEGGLKLTAKIDGHILERQGLVNPGQLAKYFLEDLRKFLEAKWSVHGT